MVDAVIDQPTTTPETSSAAPATSAPSQPSRPASFEQAFEQADAANAAKTPETEATAAIVPLGDPNAPVAGEVVPPEKKGPIPFEVHHTALANARTDERNKAIEARDQQWQEKTGWVLSLPPERQAAAPDLVRDFYAHPPSFVMNVIKAMEDHPQYGPQMRAMLSLLGGNGNGNGHQAAADAMPQPDVQVVDPETGRVVGMTYSEKALAQREALLSKQYEQRIEQRLKPFEDERKAAKNREAETEFRRKATEEVEQKTDRILKILNGRSDLLQHVNTLLDSGTNWLDAAIQVSEQHLKPQQQQQATATAADVMRRKANANTANGAGAPVTPMARPKNERELAAYMEQLAGE